MIRKAIEKLIDKKELTYEEANHVMTEIMCGKTTIVQNAAFLAALSAKCAGSGAVDEIAGCAAAMRDYALKADPLLLLQQPESRSQNRETGRSPPNPERQTALRL